METSYPRRLHSTAHAIPPIPPPTTITLKGRDPFVIVATVEFRDTPGDRWGGRDHGTFKRFGKHGSKATAPHCVPTTHAHRNKWSDRGDKWIMSHKLPVILGEGGRLPANNAFGNIRVEYGNILSCGNRIAVRFNYIVLQLLHVCRIGATISNSYPCHPCPNFEINVPINSPELQPGSILKESLDVIP